MNRVVITAPDLSAFSPLHIMYFHANINWVINSVKNLMKSEVKLCQLSSVFKSVIHHFQNSVGHRFVYFMQ